MNEFALKAYRQAEKKINDRIAKLEAQKATIKARYAEKYPYDLYGMKGELMAESKLDKLTKEIRDLRKYSCIVDSIEEAQKLS